MTLKMYNCDNCIINLDENIATLEILPKKVFINAINDFNDQIFPARELAIIDEQGEIISENEICCISDFVELDLFGKQLLNRLYRHIEKEQSYQNEDYFEICEIMESLRKCVLKAVSNLDIDFDVSEEIDLKDIYSLVKLKPMANQNDILETLIQFFNVISELKLYKVVVAIQLKAFLDDDALETLYRHSLHKGIRLIIVENQHETKLLKNEQKIFIDTDYCDILIK